MRPDNRNPEALAGAIRVECVTVEVNNADPSPICTSLQRQAAARLAARFGLGMSLALVVATLAGIGGGNA